MSQISPPIRILLVAVIAVLGVYMLFLRPKPPVAEPAASSAPNTQTSAPAVSKPGKAVEAAQNAVKATNGQLQSEESVDGVDAGESAAATASTTKTAKSGGALAAAGVDLKGLPKPVARAIRHHKTLVLLFWNGKSADDKAVHKAVAKVDRWDGRVFVHTASIRKIAKYGRIARGVDVEQSPTIVIADRDLHAETLVGYVDTLTIDQAVVDAFRNTTGVFTDPYLRKVDAVCRDYRGAFDRIPNRFTTSPKKFAAMIRQTRDLYPRFAAAFAAVPAPKRWASFRSATIADNKAAISYYDGLASYLGSHPSRMTVFEGVNKMSATVTPTGKSSYAKRMKANRLNRCVE